MQPSIIHNGTPYDVDLNIFLSLSPIALDLFHQNRSIPMIITDCLEENEFKSLINAINNNIYSTLNSGGAIPLLKSSVTYKIQDFVEKICSFLIRTGNDKEILIAFFSLIQYYSFSVFLDQYITLNFVKFCQFNEFNKVPAYVLYRLLTMYNIPTPKGQIFTNFIINYIKTNGKIASQLLGFVNFREVSIDDLQAIIENDLIDFDVIGNKVLRELTNVIQSTENSFTTKNSSNAIEQLENNLKNSKNDYDQELIAIDELENEFQKLQLEIIKLEGSFKTASKQLENAKTRRIALEKEKMDLELKLNTEEEDQILHFEEEEEKNDPESESVTAQEIHLWCPKSPLHPPSVPFKEETYLKNINKADEYMKPAPNEVVKQAEQIIGESQNSRDILMNFLYHSAIEMKQPEMCSALANILMNDPACDDFTLSLLTFAAEKNIPDALFNLGVMARLGRGLVQDDEMAAKNIVASANLGFEQAINAVKAAC